MARLLSIALVYLWISHCVSLLIYVPANPNETEILPPTFTSTHITSFYATLGDRPASLILANLSLVSSNDITNENCTIHKDIEGSIVVFTDAILPPMGGCNNDPMGSSAAFARVAQGKGAIGVVIPSVEKFSNGRVVGFTQSVVIPVLVAPMSTIDYMKTHANAIVHVALTPVTNFEDTLLSRLTTLFTVWIILNSILYGILILILGYTIYFDFLLLRSQSNYFSHNSFLKLMAFASAACSFVWHAVDPFSFHGNMMWYSCIPKSLMYGLTTIVTLLVLRIWIQAPSTSSLYLRIWSILIYAYVAVLISTSLAYGIWWHNAMAVAWHLWSHVTALVLGAAGYIIFGRNLVAIMSRGGNRAPNSQRLPIKLTIFIVFYAVVAYSLTIIAFISPIGIILDTLLVSITVVFVLLAVFLVLFLPKMMASHTPAPIKMLTCAIKNENIVVNILDTEASSGGDHT